MKSNIEGFETFNVAKDFLMVSSTSWTADENFAILFHALKSVDDKLQQSTKCDYGMIYAIITGKGPLKSHYEMMARSMSFERVRILTTWLSSENYPKLLGSKASSCFVISYQYFSTFHCRICQFGHFTSH
jgi:beta-1,4-mannosyltransferase